jgi:hypothetical protein
MKKSLVLLTAFVTIAFSINASALITELITKDTADGGYGSDRIYSHVIEGDTAYIALTLNNLPQLVRIENISSSQDRTQLMDQPEWTGLSGKTTYTPFYGMDVYGDYIYFGDSSSDQLYRLHKSDGTLSIYVDYATLTNAINDTAYSWLTPYALDPSTGNIAMYSSRNDSILLATGINTVITLVTEAELNSSPIGSDTVSGGMAYDTSGNLYWGNNTIDSFCMRASNGTLSVVLTAPQITNFTGQSAAGFSDCIAGADGLVYFYESRSDSILKFDPADPPNTLDVSLSSATLIASVAGSANVGQFSWYGDAVNGSYTWNRIDSSTAGIYLSNIPEPAVLGVLAALGLLYLRRS